MTGNPGTVTHSGARRVPAGGFTPIGRQSHEIITSILEDPSPGLAEVKRRLRDCVAAHPGSPEQALLAHLLATSQTAGDGGAAPSAAPSTVRDRATDGWRGGNMYP